MSECMDFLHVLTVYLCVSTIGSCLSGHIMVPMRAITMSEPAVPRIVDEQVFVDPDDVVDPDETQGEAGHQDKAMFRFVPVLPR